MPDALVFAAEAAEGGSHAAFYILGLALAGWAVLVSAIGILRADRFPARAAVRNGVMLISMLLVVGATASAVLTA
jgi:hypothetical protein